MSRKFHQELDLPIDPNALQKMYQFIRTCVCRFFKKQQTQGGEDVHKTWLDLKIKNVIAKINLKEMTSKKQFI